ncbi:MAG: tetratricopeptide repeat protein [Nitrospinae bacterium]|nr:tetratricopeptide repeat protein [Nitrospinota bacterium]MBL7019203.1 tetratricopeptide repeat protein [Nitrospinaceae bacterium]
MKNALKILLTISLLISGSEKSFASLPISDAVYRGYQLVQDWDIAAAEKLSEQLLKKYPESGDAHFLQARIDFMKGDYERSWKTLLQVGDNFKEIKEFKSHVDATRRAAKNFISRESEHFIFRYEPGPDEILIHHAEEVLEKSYRVLGKILHYYPKEKVLVEIYPDRKPFAQISPLTLKDILTSGTVALCKYHRITIISPGSLVRGFNWMDTLSHEYVHYLLTKKSRNHLPLWMHEGIAKYLETQWRGQKQYLSPVMETVLSNALKNDYRVPLEAMMPSLAKLKTAEDVQLAYAEVSSMMEYLAALKGRDIFPQILEDLASGAVFNDIFIKHVGQDLTAFQNSWESWAKKLELKIIPGIKTLPTEFKNRNGPENKEYTELESRRARDLAYLGDILKSRDYFKAAIVEYQKALDESSSHSPVLFNKLAGTHLQTQNYNEAESLLKESLAFFPNFHTSLANMGEVYFSNQEYETAQVYFEKAVRINPFNPFVHMRLIHVYDKLGLTREKELQARQFSYID